MLISRDNVVHRIVLIALICPIIAAFFNSKIISLLPDILSLLAFFFIFLQYRLKLNYRFYFVILLLISYSISTMIIYGKLASLGSIAVICMSIMFFKILDHEKIQLEHLIKQISFIYIINILFIYFEIIVKIIGYEFFIVELIGVNNFDNSIVAKYKDYNSAFLLRKLGFNFGGANSMILGSQSASIITLFSLFWFLPAFKADIFKGLKTNKIFFLMISLILYPFVATMTSNIILVIFLFLLTFIFYNSRLFNIFTWIFLLIITLTSYEKIYELIMFRIKTTSDMEEYTYTFFKSFVIKNYLTLDWLSLLFGSGRNSLSGISHSGDFALARVLHESGFFLVTIAIGCLLLIFFKVITLIKMSKHKLFSVNPWYTFMTINFIISFGFFVSLAHYSTAIEPGGRHLFALHLALTLLSIKKIRNLNNSYRVKLSP